jgi:hypothetical protein
MTGGGASAATFGVIGYSATTPYIASLDGGITPAPGSTLSNPFPNGISQPVGASLGALTGYGNSTLPVRLANEVNPYVGQWTLNIQRELPRSPSEKHFQGLKSGQN